MPDLYREFIEGWRLCHPQWGYILWTEDSLFPLWNQPYFDKAEEAAGKSDIARYEILWHFGGVYLDCDFECVRNIEPLVHDIEAFMGYEDPVSVNNAIIGSVPHHPALADMIREVPRRFHMPGPAFVTSGPRMVTRVVKNHSGVRLFPPDVFYPLFWSRGIDPVLTHAIHHYKTSKFARRLNQVDRPGGRLVGTSKGRIVRIPGQLAFTK